MARGRNSPHLCTPGAHQTELPVVSYDYGYLGARTREDDPQCERVKQTPMLVMHDSGTGGIYAHLIPQKGMDYPGAPLVVNVVCKHLHTLATIRKYCDISSYVHISPKPFGDPSIACCVWRMESRTGAGLAS